MPNSLSPEIFWLTLTAAWSAMLWMPYATVRIRRIGFVGVLMRPLPGDDPFEQEWAHRAYRAHMNAVESLATFAPLALAIHVTGTGNDVTATAAAAYFWSRLLYVPIYIFNVPALRLISFMIGLIASLVLVYQLIA